MVHTEFPVPNLISGKEFEVCNVWRWLVAQEFPVLFADITLRQLPLKQLEKAST